jgi:hypothetical protein
MDVVFGPAGILGMFIVLFVALALAAWRLGVDSRQLDHLPQR